MSTRHILAAAIAFISLSANAQPGCTDPYATNYNAGATTNDGSCTYAVTHYTPVLRTALPAAISESSGLVWTDGKLWTHNDSGNPAILFSIDTTDGHVLQKVYIDNHPNTDWEDLAADANYIYVGDFGNNNGSRTDLRILRIAKADITADTAVHVNADTIAFSYSDQTSFTPTPLNNYDCESMISVDDSLYVFTKDWLDQKTRVYRIPKVPGTYSVAPFTNYNVAGELTGATYNPVTKEIILIGYVGLKTLSFMWFLNNYQGHMFFSGNKRRIEIGSASEWQTEAVEFIDSNRFFISNETATVAASLYVGNKKTWLPPLAVKELSANASFHVYPNPASADLFVENDTNGGSYHITDVLGRRILSGSLTDGHNKIALISLMNGTYLLTLTDAKGHSGTQRITKE